MTPDDNGDQPTQYMDGTPVDYMVKLKPAPSTEQEVGL